MTHSKLRGHPIVCIDGEWLYEDTMTATAGNERPCGYCGKRNTKEGHDGCIGTLPNVMNACCGHGADNEAYIQYNGGKDARGKDAVDRLCEQHNHRDHSRHPASHDISASLHVKKLRRLRALQRLGFMSPNPVGEAALLADLRADPELDPTIEMVRKALTYLAEHNLVVLIAHEESDWLAAIITREGVNWLDSPLDNGLEIYTLADQPPRSANRLGRVSSIDALPMEAKFWLEAELIKNGFTGYAKLTTELNKQGYAITRSALGRYAKKLKDKFETDRSETRRKFLGAKYKVDALGDEMEVNDTLRGMAQNELLGMFLAGNELDPKSLKRMVDMTRSLTADAMKSEEYQIRKEAKQQALAQAAETAEKTLVAQGASSQTIIDIKRDILGL